MESAIHALYAFTKADETAKVFMEKWEIKDGFWHIDCTEGGEWNYVYVLPQPEGGPIKLVVPTSLQMGWVESPPYFCAATETAWDVVTEHIKLPENSLPQHKFAKYTVGDAESNVLPESNKDPSGVMYMVKVYADDIMSLIIPVSKEQL